MPDYPLAEKMPGTLKTPSGIPFEEITLEAVEAGRFTMDDLRVTPEALELQAQAAEAAARPQLAENLRRAAELAAIPEDLILEIYRALRPGRSDRATLHALAADIEARYGAARCAALLREAVT